MKVISMINYKGGVGKTTLTANLATELAKRGLKVLAIDLDPQSSLTFSFMKVEEWKERYERTKTIKRFLDSFINEQEILDLNEVIIKPDNINKKIIGSFDLICSNLGLINVDIDLALKLNGTPKQYRRNYVRVMSILRKGIQSLENKYDIVLIDCPPNFNIVTKNALVASDHYIIPTKLDYLSTLGISTLNQHINDLVKHYNLFIRGSSNEYKRICPSLIGVVGNMVGIYSNELIEVNKHYLKQLRTGGHPMFDTYIKESKTLYSDNLEYGVPIVLQDSARFKDIRSELELFTDEVKEKVGI